MAFPIRLRILAYVFSHGVTKGAKLRGKERRRLYFIVRKLRRGVQHFIGADERANFAIDHRIERLLGARRGGEYQAEPEDDNEFVFHEYSETLCDCKFAPARYRRKKESDKVAFITYWLCPRQQKC